jgi:hypothetical protein
MSSAIKNNECAGFLISTHCQRSIDVRDISLDDVIQTVNSGEVIAKYDWDKPFPSKLILNFIENSPIHVVVAQDPASLICILITAYRPDPSLWKPGFKSKKNG